MEIGNERDQWIERVKGNGADLQHAPDKIRNNRAVVLIAVKQTWQALEWASDRLKGEEEIMLVAISQNIEALKYAPSSLIGNDEFILDAIEEDERALDYVSHKMGDSEFMLQAVERNKNAFRYASEDLQNNEGFMQSAIDIIQLEDSLNVAAKNKQDLERDTLGAMEATRDSKVIQIPYGTKERPKWMSTSDAERHDKERTERLGGKLNQANQGMSPPGFFARFVSKINDAVKYIKSIFSKTKKIKPNNKLPPVSFQPTDSLNSAGFGRDGANALIEKKSAGPDAQGLKKVAEAAKDSGKEDDRLGY